MADEDERDQAEAVEDLLEEIVRALGLEATVEITEDDETVTGTVHGEDLGLFIGRHGQTIDAVQHLAQRMAGARAGERTADRHRRRGLPRAARDDAAAPGRPRRDRRAALRARRSRWTR